MHHPHSKGLLLNEISFYSAGCEDHNHCIPLIIIIIDPSLTTKLNQISTPDMILDPMFHTKEPYHHHHRNNILSQGFGVPAQITATLWNAHQITPSKPLIMYIITLQQTHLNSTRKYHAMDNILDNILLFSLPCTMVLKFQNQSAQTNAILDAITYSKGTQCKSIQCQFLKKTN